MTSLASEAQTSEALIDYSLNQMGYANATAGWTFLPLTNISITALGAFQYVVTNTPGIEVGLWDAGGDLLASNTVTASSGLVNQSLYEPITPAALTAGETYYLGGFGGPIGFRAYDTNSIQGSGSVTMSPEIQLGEGVLSTNLGFSFPDGQAANPPSAVFVPNFEFEVTPVPEPTTLFLLGGGALVFTAARRRQ